MSESSLWLGFRAGQCLTCLFWVSWVSLGQVWGSAIFLFTSSIFYLPQDFFFFVQCQCAASGQAWGDPCPLCPSLVRILLILLTFLLENASTAFFYYRGWQYLWLRLTHLFVEADIHLNPDQGLTGGWQWLTSILIQTVSAFWGWPVLEADTILFHSCPHFEADHDFNSDQVPTWISI